MFDDVISWSLAGFSTHLPLRTIVINASWRRRSEKGSPSSVLFFFCLSWEKNKAYDLLLLKLEMCRWEERKVHTQMSRKGLELLIFSHTSSTTVSLTLSSFFPCFFALIFLPLYGIFWWTSASSFGKTGRLARADGRKKKEGGNSSSSSFSREESEHYSSPSLSWQRHFSSFFSSVRVKQHTRMRHHRWRHWKKKLIIRIRMKIFLSNHVVLFILVVTTTIDASRILYLPLPKFHSAHQAEIPPESNDKPVSEEFIPSSALEQEEVESKLLLFMAPIHCCCRTRRQFRLGKITGRKSRTTANGLGWTSVR